MQRCPRRNANSQPSRPPGTAQRADGEQRRVRASKQYISYCDIIARRSGHDCRVVARRSVQLRQERDQQRANPPELLAMGVRERRHEFLCFVRQPQHDDAAVAFASRAVDEAEQFEAVGETGTLWWRSMSVSAIRRWKARCSPRHKAKRAPDAAALSGPRPSPPFR